MAYRDHSILHRLQLCLYSCICNSKLSYKSHWMHAMWHRKIHVYTNPNPNRTFHNKTSLYTWQFDGHAMATHLQLCSCSHICDFNLRDTHRRFMTHGVFIIVGYWTRPFGSDTWLCVKRTICSSWNISIHPRRVTRNLIDPIEQQGKSCYLMMQIH
jgi:hypothetical protein